MEPIDRRVLLGAAGLASVAALSKLAHAGPLNPPAGPVTPTGLTLDQLAAIASRNARPGGLAEPRIPVNADTCPPSPSASFNITQPGSYYLTADLVFAAGFGIWIDAEDVTLDLCGFTIRPQTPGSGDAIQVRRDRVIIRNGAIAGSDRGILSSNSARQNLFLEDLRITCNTLGIFLASSSAVRRCYIRVSSGDCIECSGRGSLISECHVYGASGDFAAGIVLSLANVAERCFATFCVTGFSSFAARLADCAVTGCTTGIRATDSRVLGCSVIECGVGISGSGGVIQDCEVIFSNGANGASGLGMSLGDGCTVIGCRVDRNSGGGIAAGQRSSIDRCDVSGNTGRGIAVGAGSRVARCTVSNHTTGATPAGVRLNGNNCIVEENYFTGNTVAVDATNVGNNLVARNTCLGNTSFIAVNVGGNWYPNIGLGGTNTATNPLNNVIG